MMEERRTTVDVSYDPRTGAANASVPSTTAAELSAVLDRSERAAPVLADAAPGERAAWLDAVADALTEHAQELAELADRETALGMERLTTEVARAASQLRFYGSIAVEGSYLGAEINAATATTPRLARFAVPLGPVAVFGASNFPFAFSVLGNDTGSAIAVGCPVVAKGHPAHPMTSRRLAELATEVLAAAGAPAGTFALVSGFDTGLALVRAPAVRAVGFTGSQAAGISLWRAASEREVVIPVYAEMGSVNPVVVTRDAATGIARIAEGFVGSFTLGFGQYCTKPGLFLAPTGSGAAAAVADALRAREPRPYMLTRQIASGVTHGVEELVDSGARIVARVDAPEAGWGAPAVVLATTPEALHTDPRQLEECFGPVVLVAEYDHDDDLARTVDRLPGALAATIIAPDPADPQLPGLLRRLTSKVGRVTINDWPTSVSWTWAQQHGGPWPATTDPRTTSVGAAALQRFVRPVTYQSIPDQLLPPPVHPDNPWRIPRRVDGTITLPA